MIHPDTVEQILDKARIEEVISDFISLKIGVKLQGCCPFHNEKHPRLWCRLPREYLNVLAVLKAVMLLVLLWITND